MKAFGCWLLVALPSSALAAAADSESPRRWALGIGFGVANTPGGHDGLSVSGDSEGAVLAPALLLRRELHPLFAIDAGLGVPHPGLGPAVWVGIEQGWRLWAAPSKAVALEVYVNPGLQLGFAGPDWFARHDNAWVGFSYFYSGPVAFAVRFSAGACLTLARGLFDTFVEAVPLLVLTPLADTLFALSVGVRVHF